MATAGSAMAINAALMTFQKFFFISLLRRHWIHLLHVFELSGRNLRQMTNEVHQFPVVRVVVLAAPRGHAGQPYAIPDDEEQFAVAEILSPRLTHVRNSGIKVRTHLAVAASIVRVTRRAMIGEMIASFPQRRWSQRERIAQPACGDRKRQMGL